VERIDVLVDRPGERDADHLIDLLERIALVLHDVTERTHETSRMFGELHRVRS
jgi:hypothetical protein